jgi:hypothetical protein
MSEVIAARYWECEYCKFKRHNLEEVLEHLVNVHRVNHRYKEANTAKIGDLIITSSLVVPKILQNDDAVIRFMADGNNIAKELYKEESR